MPASLDTDPRRPVAEDDAPVLVTTGEAAILANVEPATVRRWKARGKLSAAGVNDRGENLYALPDVFAVQRGEDPRTRWRRAAT